MTEQPKAIMGRAIMASGRGSAGAVPRPRRARDVPGGRAASWWRSAWLWLVLAAAAGLALRLPWLHDSLFGDEVGAFYDVSGHGLGRVLYLVGGHSPELNPPLYFILAWLSEQVFGTSAESLRAISLLCGMAAIPLTYLLGCWTAGRRAGLVAAAIVTVSPFLIFYSSEARPYALLLCLCLLSTLALLRARESGGRWWWAAYAAASCAAAYTHFVSIFLLAAQLVWAFVAAPRSRRALVLSNLAAAAAFLPWLPSLIRTARSPGTKLYGALEPFGLHAIRLDLGQLWFGVPLHPVSAIPGVAAVAIAAAALAIGLSDRTLYARVRTRGGTPTPGAPAEPVLILVLALGVPVLTALYSAVTASVWNSRNLIASWPALAVLFAAIATRPPLARRTVASALLLGGLAFGAVKMLAPRYHRPDYAGAVAFIAHTSRGREPIVEWPDLSPGPPDELEVALQIAGLAGRHPTFRVGGPPLSAVIKAPPYTALPSTPGELIAARAAAAAGTGRLFLVLPGAVPVATLNAARTRRVSSRPDSPPLQILGAFLSALPTRFHVTAMHSEPGLHRVTVYVFDG